MKLWMKFEVHITSASKKHDDKLLWQKELQHDDMTEPGKNKITLCLVDVLRPKT